MAEKSVDHPVTQVRKYGRKKSRISIRIAVYSLQITNPTFLQFFIHSVFVEGKEDNTHTRKVVHVNLLMKPILAWANQNQMCLCRVLMHKLLDRVVTKDGGVIR